MRKKICRKKIFCPRRRRRPHEEKEENIWSTEQKKNRKRKGGKYLVHRGEEGERGKINGGVDN